METTAMVSLGTWLGLKIADKGFDVFYKKLFSSPDFNKRFYKAIERTSDSLRTKYPDVLGGSIDYFFKHETVFNELVKSLFVNAKTDWKFRLN